MHPPPPSEQVLYQQTPANTPVRGFDGNDPAPQSEDGDGWNAILTPEAGHTLDVELKHRFNFQSEVTCVRFSPSGDLVALGCKRMASAYDTKTGNGLRDLDHGIEAYIYSVCFHHKEKLLATGDVEGTMRIWKVDDGTLTGSFHVDSRCHVSVDFARNDFAGKGDLLAFGSTDGNVRLWDVAQGKVVRTLEAEASINSVALSNNTKYVVAGLAGNLGVQVWDIDSGHVVAHFQGPKGHSGPVMSVAFSPDDVYVFTGSLDKTVKVWLLNVSRGGNASLESERCVRTYEGHEGFVTSVASMARWVLSGSADRKLSLWNPTTGTVEMKLDGHDPEPKKRAVSSVDGNASRGLIVAGSTDMKACVWCVRERPTS